MNDHPDVTTKLERYRAAERTGQKLYHLSRVIAELRQASERADSLTLERDELIRDLIRTGEYGPASTKLAKACGLTRGRIHQIANS